MKSVYHDNIKEKKSKKKYHFNQSLFVLFVTKRDYVTLFDYFSVKIFISGTFIKIFCGKIMIDYTLAIYLCQQTRICQGLK